MSFSWDWISFFIGVVFAMFVLPMIMTLISNKSSSSDGNN